MVVSALVFFCELESSFFLSDSSLGLRSSSAERRFRLGTRPFFFSSTVNHLFFSMREDGKFSQLLQSLSSPLCVGSSFSFFLIFLIFFYGTPGKMLFFCANFGRQGNLFFHPAFFPLFFSPGRKVHFSLGAGGAANTLDGPLDVKGLSFFAPSSLPLFSQDPFQGKGWVEIFPKLEVARAFFSFPSVSFSL